MGQATWATKEFYALVGAGGPFLGPFGPSTPIAAGGGVQAPPLASAAGGVMRQFISTLPFIGLLPLQTIAVARLPLGSVVSGIIISTPNAAFSSRIRIGDPNALDSLVDSNLTQSPQFEQHRLLVKNLGTPISRGWDAITGNEVTASSPGSGGGGYADIVMFLDNLPPVGMLELIFQYSTG